MSPESDWGAYLQEVKGLRDEIRTDMHDIRNETRLALADIKQQFANYVLEQTYTAHRQADTQRIGSLEAKIDKQEERSRLNTRAIALQMLALVGQLIFFYVTRGR